MDYQNCFCADHKRAIDIRRTTTDWKVSGTTFVGMSPDSRRLARTQPLANPVCGNSTNVVGIWQNAWGSLDHQSTEEINVVVENSSFEDYDDTDCKSTSALSFFVEYSVRI